MSTTDPLREAANSLLAPSEPPVVETEEQSEQVEVEAEEVATEPEQAGDEAEQETPEAEQAEGEDDAEAVAADQKQPERISVKVDGKEVEVTLDDLKRAYSGQAHIQRGMQEAAEQKKQAQAILDALQSEQARFTEFARAVQQNGFKARPQAPDPGLAKTDPIRYVEEYANYQQAHSAYEAEQAEVARFSTAQQAVTQQQRLARLQEQQRILEGAIPGYSDPVKGKEVKDALRKTGEAYGYKAEELVSIDDARAVQVLHDAMQWRQLQAAKAQPKVAPPKNVKPQARRPEPAQLARARQLESAKKTGKLEDFAKLLINPTP